MPDRKHRSTLKNNLLRAIRNDNVKHQVNKKTQKRDEKNV